MTALRFHARRVYRLFDHVVSRRWNLRRAAQRGIAQALVAGVVGFAGVLIAPFVVLGAALWQIGLAAFKCIQFVGRRVDLVADHNVAEARGVRGELHRGAGPAARIEGRVARPGGAVQAERSHGTLVKAGEGRRLPVKLNVAASARTQTRGRPGLKADDFVRSIEAMARHGWRGRHALQQLQGLGADWIWSQEGGIEVRVRPRGVGGRTGARPPAREVRLGYHRPERWVPWASAPDVEISLYLDADDVVLGGWASDRKIRL